VAISSWRAASNVSLPGLDREVAQALIHATHEICPSSSDRIARSTPYARVRPERSAILRWRLTTSAIAAAIGQDVPEVGALHRNAAD
jgi:hypothetical protein